LAIVDLKLPVDGADANPSRQPWLLHSMDVNALNFCAFATCNFRGENDSSGSGSNLDSANKTQDQDRVVRIDAQPILIAAPNGLDSGGIDFFHLPSEHRVSKLPADTVTKTGMVMALSMFYHSTSGQLTIVSGYEDGHTMIHIRIDLSVPSDQWRWQKILTSKPHSQPLLSLDVSPLKDFYITSSADAIIAKFTMPDSPLASIVDTKSSKTVNTKHAGQQGLCLRSDGRIFATAGWDARIRVYSSKTLKELAVLKWHKDGCYSVAFAEVEPLFESEAAESDSTELVRQSDERKSALEIIRQERSAKAQCTHWLAAGGKDGKVSLWDVY
jgi:ASTRA-associated protein 1